MKSGWWRIPKVCREVLWKATEYTPGPEQEIAHLDTHRVRMVAGGERGGKSRWTGAEISNWCFYLEGGLIWLVGPDYEQARQEFRYVIDDLAKMGLLDLRAGVSTPKVGGWQAYTIHGTEISTRSAKDFKTLAGRAPDAVAMTEAAQTSLQAYLRCRGRVAERRGPLILSGTFETSLGWYADAWTRWQSDNADDAKSFSLPSWSNLAIYPGGRDDPEIKALERTTPPDLFMERYGAIPCPPATRVMKEFNHAHHVSPEAVFVRSEPVQLWVDPGYNHPYAVLAVQLRPGTDGQNVDHFDEVWEKGKTAKEIIEICKDKAWWFRVKAVVMDVAGKQHPGAESQSEIWKAETSLPIIMNKVPVVDGILRHRTYLMDDPNLGRPRLRHNPCCKGTIWEYNMYRYQQLAETRAATELPIDANNDAMKALAYGLVANFGFVDTKRRRDRNAVQVKFN